MIKYHCRTCGQDSDINHCPSCGSKKLDAESKIYWCSHCRIPVYGDICPLCQNKGSYLAADIRPVFPEERLLLEIILGEPFSLAEKSVWKGSSYLVDGRPVSLTIGTLKYLDDDIVREKYAAYQERNSDESFKRYIERFCQANRERYEEISTEAKNYICAVSKGKSLTDMFVSFSGGKDSTVTADLVIKALGTSGILHIFGDTTLEFPQTMEYVKRYRKNNPRTPVVSSRNQEKNFMELCRRVGPPSRVMRWCCTVFKTGAIQRKIAVLFKEKKQIITFYGIRRSESVSRSKYDREADSPKITRQLVVSPIIDWTDFDVWLYILTTKIDFNEAYRLGFSRVGCFCCPNNSMWSEFLTRVHLPQLYRPFQNLLIEFACKIGKPDPENYVQDGKWKARQGGNGLEIARTSVIVFEPCALQENTLNFELQRPVNEELYELFRPFGYLNYELGNSRLGEVYVVGKKGEMILKLAGRKGSSLLKVTVLNDKAAGARSRKAAIEKVKCQITKYQMCLGCLACESICRMNAISIRKKEDGRYTCEIDDKRCIRCRECISHFDAGCYMRKILTIKRD